MPPLSDDAALQEQLEKLDPNTEAGAAYAQTLAARDAPDVKEASDVGSNARPGPTPAQLAMVEQMKARDAAAARGLSGTLPQPATPEPSPAPAMLAKMALGAKPPGVRPTGPRQIPLALPGGTAEGAQPHVSAAPAARFMQEAQAPNADVGPGVATNAPAAPAAPTGDDELTAAQKAVEARRQRAHIITSLFGGKRDTEAENAPVSDILQRRQLAAAKIQDQLKAAQEEKVARLSDPSSRESKLAQAIAVRNYGIAPDEAKQLAAADLPMLHQGFTASEAIEQRKAATEEKRVAAEGQAAARVQTAQIAADQRRESAADRNATMRALHAGINKPVNVGASQSQNISSSATTAEASSSAQDAYNQALKTKSPADWAKYNTKLKLLGIAVAAGENKTGTARKDVIDKIVKEAPGLGSAASDTLIGNGMGANYFDTLREEARLRGSNAIEGLGLPANHPLVVQHQRVFGGGGHQASAGGPVDQAAAPTHYSYSRDRKQRIPVTPDGKPLGPAEPNPGG